MSDHEKTAHAGALPSRGDGKDWAPQHLRAAQIRARGKSWQVVAKELGYKAGTVMNYSQIPAWDKLVDHYRNEIFDQEIERYFKQGSVEALAAIRLQWKDDLEALEEIEDRLADGDLDEEDAKYLRQARRRRSKDVIFAADRFLHNVGFRKHAEARAAKDALAEESSEEREASAEDVARLLGVDMQW